MEVIGFTQCGCHRPSIGQTAQLRGPDLRRSRDAHKVRDRNTRIRTFSESWRRDSGDYRFFGERLTDQRSVIV